MSSIRSRAPHSASPAVRRFMQANRSIDTAVERLLRSALHRQGLRFGKHANVDPAVKCRADVVFRRARVCVFIDGCYWHGCPKHFQTPKRNAAWWQEKIGDNRSRDRRKTSALRRRGWKVIRIWEHEVSTRSVSQLVSRIEMEVRGKPTPEGAPLGRGADRQKDNSVSPMKRTAANTT
jgi:DNA mismatch endonuclease, patch repair protein